MTTPTVEIRLTLAANTARKLQETAQTHGVPAEVLVEQALALLFGPDDAPSRPCAKTGTRPPRTGKRARSAMPYRHDDVIAVPYDYSDLK